MCVCTFKRVYRAVIFQLNIYILTSKETDDTVSLSPDRESQEKKNHIRMSIFCLIYTRERSSPYVHRSIDKRHIVIEMQI